MEWQKCPVCNGSGLVSGGFYNHAGDCLTWMSNCTIEVCRTCDGKGIILKPTLVADGEGGVKEI